MIEKDLLSKLQCVDTLYSTVIQFLKRNEYGFYVQEIRSKCCCFIVATSVANDNLSYYIYT